MDIKKIGIYAALALALVTGGYAAGRYASPAKVVVTEKVSVVHDVQVVKVVDQDAILSAIKDVSRQNDVHVVKITKKAPDGTVTTTETRDDKTKTETKADTKAEVKTQVSTKENSTTIETKEVTKTIIGQIRPSWSLALQPGIDFAGALGHGTPYSLLPSSDLYFRHVVVGVGVDHRFIGPLYLGAWANTSGAGGLTIRLDL